ncbi:hypothetical protein TSUD_225820 [Trifolium subterraneum]|uniref:Small ribosomal subunit protein mS41 SAM domain-containing protein n=1 Tax=Trifolium subterraneum TaxID=3900 RepID=A0A2Z6N3X4_TRISU|nr:hypothetical protein TSUD_225820 [Trifolium subterraneum]
MALWLQLQRVIRNGSVNLISTLPHSSRSFSKSTPYVVKVGIPEFLNGIGKGVESHVAKLDSEIGDFQKLLVTRTLKLKKLGVPCKHPRVAAGKVAVVVAANGVLHVPVVAGNGAVPVVALDGAVVVAANGVIPIFIEADNGAVTIAANVIPAHGSPNCCL